MSARFIKFIRYTAAFFLLLGIALFFYSLHQVSRHPSSRSAEAFALGRISAQAALEKVHANNILFQKQCVRCHEAPQFGPVPYQISCVECHQKILAGEFNADFSRERIKKWSSRIEHLLIIPDFESIARRLRPDWVRGFLENPQIIRPHLGAAMPKVPLSRDEIEKIVQVLSYEPKPHSPQSQLSGGDILRGAELFRERGCAECHRYQEESDSFRIKRRSSFRQVPNSIRLAPDLRFTRERMTRAQASDWIRSPGSQSRPSLMPPSVLSEEETRDLLSYLFDAPLANLKIEAPLAPPIPLRRPVTYKEIEERITKRICWHCHSDASPMLGDGGPGNTGGLGFDGTGLDLGSYEGILRGSTKRQQAKRSVLEKDENGVPKIIRHLLARHEEINGRFDPDIVGMPLGLPPLSREDIGIFWTWIEQGAKSD